MKLCTISKSHSLRSMGNLRRVLQATLLTSCVTFVACGGSSGDNTEFSGSVVRTDMISNEMRAENGIPNVEVCALGKCNVSNEFGDWSFGVDRDTFESGPVLFTLTGDNVMDEIVVSGVDDESEEVIINFGVDESGQVIFNTLDQQDFDDDLDDEIEEEAEDTLDDIDDEADEVADDIDDEADEIADDIDDEADSAADSIDEEVSEVF